MSAAMLLDLNINSDRKDCFMHRYAQKRMLLAFSLLAFAFSDTHAETPEQKGLRLMTEIENANSGFGSDSAQLELAMINAQGDKISRRLEVQAQEFSGDGDRSMVTFSWPADVKGTRMLTWAHPDGDDDQWLYLSAIKRVKRIATNNKSSSFMGSEFSYEDMSTPELPEYNYKFLEEVKYEDHDCWKIERISTSKNTGYSKEVVYYDRSIMNPIRIEYFDRRGEMWKVAALSDYKKYDQWWRPGAIEMTNIKNGKKSVMTWLSYELRDLRPDEFFTRDNLED